VFVADVVIGFGQFLPKSYYSPVPPEKSRCVHSGFGTRVVTTEPVEHWKAILMYESLSHHFMKKVRVNMTMTVSTTQYEDDMLTADGIGGGSCP
jgi:hypothetical protein